MSVCKFWFINDRTVKGQGKRKKNRLTLPVGQLSFAPVPSTGVYVASSRTHVIAYLPSVIGINEYQMPRVGACANECGVYRAVAAKAKQTRTATALRIHRTFARTARDASIRRERGQRLSWRSPFLSAKSTSVIESKTSRSFVWAVGHIESSVSTSVFEEKVTFVTQGYFFFFLRS